MNFDKIGTDWNRVTFSLEQDTPQDQRVEMFVRRHDQGGWETYDVGWANEFKSDTSCDFKALDIISQEIGINFEVIGIKGDLSKQFILEKMTRRDVVWLHAISRFWAIKNGLLLQMRQMRESNLNIQEAADMHAREAQELLRDKERILNDKMKKLEQMTFKVMKQNVTIYKTIKKRKSSAQTKKPKPKSFWAKIFG